MNGYRIIILWPLWLQHLLKGFPMWHKMMCHLCTANAYQRISVIAPVAVRKYPDERNSRKERFPLDQSWGRVQFSIIEVSKRKNPSHLPHLIFTQEGERSEYLCSNSFLHFLKPRTGASEGSIPSSLVDLLIFIFFSYQDKHS